MTFTRRSVLVALAVLSGAFLGRRRRKAINGSDAVRFDDTAALVRPVPETYAEEYEEAYV